MQKNYRLTISFEFNMLQTICSWFWLDSLWLYISWSFLLDIWRGFWLGTVWLERTGENKSLFFEQGILDWRPRIAKDCNCYNCFKHNDVCNCIKQNKYSIYWNGCVYARSYLVWFWKRFLDSIGRYTKKDSMVHLFFSTRKRL